jgi:KUP system potassium uptake protein
MQTSDRHIIEQRRRGRVAVKLMDYCLAHPLELARRQSMDGNSKTSSGPLLEHPQGREPTTSVSTALAALGIVYGDLGTSPLYTYQTIVGTVGGHPTSVEAIGLLSLVVWALIITVSVKYCVFVMRADNLGEGGIMALMALVTTKARRRTMALTLIGLFGAALLYGDGVITPAISVLSALEGINVATDIFKPYVLPASLFALVALFAAQMRGTASIGRVFGPVMLLWFVTIGALGFSAAVHEPRVLLALNPSAAAGFLARHGLHSFIVLGGVFLAVTGGEALYADMGGVGRNPIRFGWYALVLPSLLLCYAGQTAILIANPSLEGNPFFQLAPHWAVIPLVALATVATIIASQAIITGASSLTRQAMQLGWFPGLNIRQTSDREYGQIYVSAVNWTMMVCTIIVAYGFGSSDALAGAYGTAVSTTMLLTTALLFNAMRDVWGWSPMLSALVSGLLLLVDLAFFAANILKIREGGWVPLVLGAVVLTIMLTWRRGMDALRSSYKELEESPNAFLAWVKKTGIPRVPGTAVFLSRTSRVVTPLLLRHVAQMKALQEIVVSLMVRFEPVPRVQEADRTQIEQVAPGFWHVTVQFGFVEIPNIPAALAQAKNQGCPIDAADVVYFASHNEVVRSPTVPRMPAWQRMLFAAMFRNAGRTPDRFDLPPDKFLEVGRQVAI